MSDGGAVPPRSATPVQACPGPDASPGSNTPTPSPKTTTTPSLVAHTTDPHTASAVTTRMATPQPPISRAAAAATASTATRQSDLLSAGLLGVMTRSTDMPTIWV